MNRIWHLPTKYDLKRVQNHEMGCRNLFDDSSVTNIITVYEDNIELCELERKYHRGIFLLIGLKKRGKKTSSKHNSLKASSEKLVDIIILE